MRALLPIVCVIGLIPSTSWANWLQIEKSNQLTNKSLLLAQGTAPEVEPDPVSAVSRLVKKIEDLQQQLVKTQRSLQETDERRQKAERERDELNSERLALQKELQQYQAERQSMLEQQRTREQELKGQLVEAKKKGDAQAEQARLELERLRSEHEQQLLAGREAIRVQGSPNADPTARPGEISELSEKGQAEPGGLESAQKGRSGSRSKVHPPEREILGDDGVKMILIPAGDFTMGSNEQLNEKPPHHVFLDDFYMDVNEMTTEQYARFLDATKRPEPSYWKSVNLSHHSDRPVVGITWEDAQAYCAWAGKRLPTEAEWEKAARGTDRRMYPWGEKEPSFQEANFGKAMWNGYETLSPVGAMPHGQSPYGINDLAGNVWEWVADWFDADYYKQSSQRNPIGPEIGTTKVLRGGAWDLQPNFLRAPYRSGAVPTTRHYTIGFRCSRSLRP
jgi:formylglycine-generating enzyme required for sulfatase activity